MINDRRDSWLIQNCIFIPRHTKSGGVLCYALRTVWVSVHPYVRPHTRPSICPSALCFRTLTWVVFDRFSSNFAWTLILIANRLNSFLNNRVMALDWCKNVFFLNIFRTNGWILIKFCICIDIYKIHVVSNAHYFWSVMALDWHQNFVYAQYLVN